MANTLELGNGKWATGKDTVLAFNDQNNNFKPLPFSFSRASSGTVVNKDGLIETVGSGEPRIDFKDNTKGALLLEPSRTNYLTQSNQFDTTWNLDNITISSNETGVGESVDAWKLIPSTANTYHRITNSTSGTQNLAVTLSVYAKADGYNFLRISENGSTGHYATFNLLDGIVENNTSSEAKIESVGNGWYRCSSSIIATTLHRFDMYVMQSAEIQQPWSGDGTSGIYIQYAQLEQGSYPTSYIPTSGSAVTRVGESSSQTLPDGVIGQTEGTVFLDFIYNNNAANTRIFSVTGNSWISNGSIRLEKSGIYFKWNWINNGVASGGLTSTSFMVVGQRYKMAITYNSTSASLFIDGVKEDTSSVTTSTSINKIHLNELGGGFSDIYEFQKNNFNQVLLYNTELTDQEAIALTQ
jgi:hypothetical protein